MVETVPQHLSAEYDHQAQAEWSQASTLAERLATLRTSEANTARQWPYDRELAERRRQRWQQQAPFEQEQYFADRLKLDQLTEEEFLILLGEAPEDLQKRLPDSPAWLDALFSSFSEAFSQSALPSYTPPVTGFLPVLAPLLKRSYARLLEHIQALKASATSLPFDADAVGMLFLPHLAGRLAQLSIKAFTLELNIARLEGRLEGKTPTERFQAFLRSLADPTSMLDLLRVYPVLARQIITIAGFWETSSLEILTRLCRDWSEICATFSPAQDPGHLTAVEIGIGDTHCQGQSVAKLTFASGLRLIYKPKSLRIDEQIIRLFARFNAWDDHLPLRVANVINRESYGWVEFIEAHTCTTSEEIEHFYERLGSLLAILYILDATDMHLENIIASGEDPILIDLESLFHPDIPVDRGAAKSPGTSILQSSVMRSGLLPREIWQQGDAEGIDVSGLGGRGGQLTPSPVPLFKESGTDQMRMVRERMEIDEQQNRPKLAGKAVEARAYLAQFVEGFARTYRLLLAHRQELLDEQIPLFAHIKVRVITRPTRQYGQILNEGTHPTLLRNGLDQARFFDRLWTSVPQLPALARLIYAEQEDLRVGDIPMFWTYTDSLDLFTSRDERIPDLFTESSLSHVRRKIEQLSAQDLERQLWMIHASMLMTHLEPGQVSWKASQLQTDMPDVTASDLLHAACEIGDRLCEQTICADESVSWLTLHLIGERSWNIVPTDVDMYNGMAGICLFLAYLGEVSKQDRYTQLARQTLKTIHQQIKQLSSKKRRSSIGFFAGWSGLLYLCAHLAALWQEPAIACDAQELLPYFVDSIEEDTAFDIISGSAGCILALLTLYQVSPTPEILQVALRCGEHLLNHATPQSCGLGWPSLLTEEGKGALTGFSHGAAGIALSLLRLASVSGERRFHEAGLAALAYERSLYSPEIRNWPDLRTISRTDHGPGSMLTWCHGAPGIGMARLASLPYCDDARIREEIALAIDITLEQSFGTNHSLCHGDLGNLELLLSAAQQFPDEARYQSAVTRLSAQELESIQRQGWCTGVPHSFEVPGLMSGIAGIGYGLLRLAAPDRVPSVLLLAAPLVALEQKKD